MLDKKKIHLEHPIRTLGEHEVELRLHADVVMKLKVRVESSTPLPARAPEAKPREEGRTEKRGRRPEQTVRAESPERAAKSEPAQKLEPAERKPRPPKPEKAR